MLKLNLELREGGRTDASLRGPLVVLSDGAYTAIFGHDISLPSGKLITAGSAGLGGARPRLTPNRFDRPVTHAARMG
jgi:hypothetical protein